MILTRTNERTVIDGSDLDVRYAKSVLDKPLSYKVAGAEFSPAYKSHHWDGRKRLLTAWKGKRLACPAGLHDLVEKVFRDNDTPFSVVDQRSLPDYVKGGDLPWAGHPPYDHQKSAFGAALRGRGGILRLPIRSGKTELAALLTWWIGGRTLFVAPSEHLLTQTLRSYQRALPGLKVTALGCGYEDDSGDVVVSSIQTICARAIVRDKKEVKKAKDQGVVRDGMSWRPWWNEFSKKFTTIFFDELHHFDGGGEEWTETVQEFSAPYKFGLSATVPDTDAKMLKDESMWLRALCGPLVYSIGLSELIERGILVRPTIHFVPYEADRVGGGWGQAAYTQHVVNCRGRNALIVDYAVRYAQEGRAVLVDCSRVGHARALQHEISGRLRPGQTVLLTGDSSREARDAAVRGMESGKIAVAVATIFGEGIDIGRLSVVINAEGGQGDVGTIQRLRNLTPSPGKTDAIVIEPYDQSHSTLRGWVRTRLATYRTEPAFEIVLP